MARVTYYEMDALMQSLASMADRNDVFVSNGGTAVAEVKTLYWVGEVVVAVATKRKGRCEVILRGERDASFLWCKQDGVAKKYRN